MRLIGVASHESAFRDRPGFPAGRKRWTEWISDDEDVRAGWTLLARVHRGLGRRLDHSNGRSAPGQGKDIGTQLPDDVRLSTAYARVAALVDPPSALLDPVIQRRVASAGAPSGAAAING